MTQLDCWREYDSFLESPSSIPWLGKHPVEVAHVTLWCFLNSFDQQKVERYWFGWISSNLIPAQKTTWCPLSVACPLRDNSGTSSDHVMHLRSTGAFGEMADNMEIGWSTVYKSNLTVIILSFVCVEGLTTFQHSCKVQSDCDLPHHAPHRVEERVPCLPL